MKNIRKLWIATSSEGSFPFWETEITDNEELKNECDDFKNSLCLVPYDDLKEEKEKVEKLKKCVEFYANPDEMGKDVYDHHGDSVGYVNSKDFEKVDGFDDLHYGKHARETLKEIESNHGK